MSLFCRHENFVRITGKGGNEDDGGIVLENDSLSAFSLGRKDVLKQDPPGPREMMFGDSRFNLNRPEHEVGRVDLAMRMRVRYAYNFAFVLEDQHVIDFTLATEFEILRLPDLEKVLDFGNLKFCQPDVMSWAVADDSGDAGCRAYAIDTTGLV